MKMNEHGDMENHINVMLDIVDQLTSFGETLAENLVVALMLCSLPDSYDTLITALESRADDDLTLELVKGKLIQEHKRRNELQSEANEGETETALKVQTGKNFKKFSKSNKKCFNCGKVGHIKRDCFLLKSSRGDGAHMVKVCNADNTPNKDYICFKASGLSNVNEWYIDSDATCHMSNDETFFTSLDKKIKSKVIWPMEGALSLVV